MSESKVDTITKEIVNILVRENCTVEQSKELLEYIINNLPSKAIVCPLD